MMEVLGHSSRWRRGWMAGIVGVLILIVVAGCDTGTTRPVAVATANATTTLTPTVTRIYFYQNTLLVPDSGWDTDQNCFFVSDGFHVKPNVACQTPVRGLSSVDVSVWLRGAGNTGASTDENGIEVRRSSNPASLYEFGIAANSAWSFKVCTGGFANCTILTSGRSPVIHGVEGDWNEVEVRAVGSHFTLLVNNTQVGQTDDATLGSGDVWLATEGRSECVFTYLAVARP